MKDNNAKLLLSKINKLIAHHVVDEVELGNIYDLLCRHIGIPNKTERKAAGRFENPRNDPNRKLIAVDFDGVIHTLKKEDKPLYSTSFSPTEFLNPPIPHAIEWLKALANDGRFYVTIYSVRSKVLGFDEALRSWLLKNGMDEKTINKISISSTKPAAFLFIDDRSWKFNGKFPRLDDLLTFKAWWETI